MAETTNKSFEQIYDMAINFYKENKKGDLEVAKQNGNVISIECNREFESCGLYVKGMDYQVLCQHDGLEKLWKTELEKQNKDYSISMKVPWNEPERSRRLLQSTERYCTTFEKT